MKPSASHIRRSAKSPNTRKAYAKSWRIFDVWCITHKPSFDSLDVDSSAVTQFLLDMHEDGLSLSTLKIYRCAINNVYRAHGKESPAATTDIDELLVGIQRMFATPERRVNALREFELKRMLDECGSGLYGLRDCAMLALGFSAAMRRHELCDLRVSDLERKDVGITIHVRQSKTDKTGAGQTIPLIQGDLIKPIEKLDAWLDASKIRHGYLFQTLAKGFVPTGRRLDYGSVAVIVKKYAERIGLDPSKYSGHSLRAGFVTSAAVHHARIDKIMEVTRHKSTDTVLRYMRDEDAFTDHAGSSFL